MGPPCVIHTKVHRGSPAVTPILLSHLSAPIDQILMSRLHPITMMHAKSKLYPQAYYSISSSLLGPY